ncbi:hypothetical protein GS614_08920 [Ruegeria sp. HKCCD6604]|nr:hypothetical protein [Ruegeria sp. HKCCD6604]
MTYIATVPAAPGKVNAGPGIPCDAFQPLAALGAPAQLLQSGSNQNTRSGGDANMAPTSFKDVVFQT